MRSQHRDNTQQATHDEAREWFETKVLPAARRPTSIKTIIERVFEEKEAHFRQLLLHKDSLSGCNKAQQTVEGETVGAATEKEGPPSEPGQSTATHHTTSTRIPLLEVQVEIEEGKLKHVLRKSVAAAGAKTDTEVQVANAVGATESYPIDGSTHIENSRQNRRSWYNEPNSRWNRDQLVIEMFQRDGVEQRRNEIECAGNGSPVSGGGEGSVRLVGKGRRYGTEMETELSAALNRLAFCINGEQTRQETRTECTGRTRTWKEATKRSGGLRGDWVQVYAKQWEEQQLLRKRRNFEESEISQRSKTSSLFGMPLQFTLRSSLTDRANTTPEASSVYEPLHTTYVPELLETPRSSSVLSTPMSKKDALKKRERYSLSTHSDRFHNAKSYSPMNTPNDKGSTSLAAHTASPISVEEYRRWGPSRHTSVPSK